MAGSFEGVNDQISVLVQIESAKGVAAAAEIAAMDGVDGLFIGPSDLAAGLGHPGNANHPSVQAAMAQVLAAGKAAAKPIGILAPLEADARRYLALGASVVAAGSDLGVFRAGTQAPSVFWPVRSAPRSFNSPPQRRRERRVAQRKQCSRINSAQLCVTPRLCGG